MCAVVFGIEHGTLMHVAAAHVPQLVTGGCQARSFARGCEVHATRLRGAVWDPGAICGDAG